MEKLERQDSLIIRLRERQQEKGLSIDQIVALMPEDQKKVGRSTCQKLFSKTAPKPEDLNFNYNSLFAISDVLLDEEDDQVRLDFKKELINVLQEKIYGLEQEIDSYKLKFSEAENRYHKKLEYERNRSQKIIDERGEYIKEKDSQMSKLLDMIAIMNGQQLETTKVIQRLLEKCDNCKFHAINEAQK